MCIDIVKIFLIFFYTTLQVHCTTVQYTLYSMQYTL